MSSDGPLTAGLSLFPECTVLGGHGAFCVVFIWQRIIPLLHKSPQMALFSIAIKLVLNKT